MTQSSQTRTLASHALPLVPALALVWLMGSASPALAQDADTASCSFLEIEASNDGVGTDPKLLPLTKTFERPPLSAWKKFTLLAKHDQRLALGKSEDVDTTSNKAKLEVVYEEYTKGKKERFKLSLSFKRADGKKLMTTSVTVDAGDYLVISMPSKQRTSNFLAITCKR
jgi:hypothetical protein